ncbi:MAG: class I SAM-dependent methyltransferase [Acidimicrobiales bacterium]
MRASTLLDRLRRMSAPPVPGAAPPAPPGPGPWPEDSYTVATAEVVQFFGDEGIDLRGTALADIGCGDGVMDLGMVHHAEPSLVVGYDINAVDTASLLARARARGVAGAELPAELRFEVCGDTTLPAADHTFDHVFSWSAFEHVLRPLPVLKEAHRVLKPGGFLMIQLWPFYHSKHGSHLWDWFPDGFAQLLYDPAAVEGHVLAHPDQGPAWTDALLGAFRELNRITLDDLHRALLGAGFDVVKLQLLTETFHIPEPLAHLPLSLLGTSGVKLLAAPQ